MNKQISLAITGMVLVVMSLFLVSAVTIKDVSSSPREVAPGETLEVSIKVENIFSYDVENVNVELNLVEVPFAPYQKSASDFLEELESEEDEKFNFKLIALPEASSGVYKIPVVITYLNDDEEEKTKTSLISVTVNAKPELKLSVDENGVLIKGREGTLTLKLVNSGLSDVRFVYVTPDSTTRLNILSEKEQYVGDLDSDDFDSVEYSVYISNSATNNLNVPVVLKYRDATNKEFTETQTVKVRVYSLEDAQSMGLVAKSDYALYGGIGAVVLLYLVYRWRKKRKNKRRV